MKNDLAVANLHNIIGTITDSIIDYTELPDALKRRDRREPGRLRKMAYEEKIQKILRKRWKKQRERIAQTLQMWYPGRKQVKPPIITPDDLEDDETESDLMILLVGAYQHGVNLFEDSVLIGMDYTAVNTRAVAWAKKYTYDLVKGIDKTTMESLQTAISAFAKTPGMTIGDVVDMLPFNEKRGMNIATTEITRTYASAEIEAGLELKKQFPDVRVVKTWFTNADDRVCPICGPLEGMEVDIDEEFDNGIMQPGDTHIGCRCWISTRIKING